MSKQGGNPVTNTIRNLRKKTNKNVSTEVLSQVDKAEIDHLFVKPKYFTAHGNSKAICWQHIGYLYSKTNNKMIDASRYFCQICLEDQKKTGTFHISSVASFSLGTSTGNLNQHLSLKHDINTADENKEILITNYLTKYNRNDHGNTPTTAVSQQEFNRDLLIWFCRDLISFESIAKVGFKDFFQKNFPSISLPTPSTLSITALNDMYHGLKEEIQNLLMNVKFVCLMFDGWTDKYKRISYLGLRVSFIKDWKFCIVTLSCEPLQSHTGEKIAEHVRSVLDNFFPDVRSLFLTSCHDGAANMKKASRLLRVENFQHCAAHALHLLLTTDSVNELPELVDLLQKCRDIVKTLSFKAYMLQEELTAKEDIRVLQDILNKAKELTDILELDNKFPVCEDSEEEDLRITQTTSRQRVHIHQTLKSSCPTRWNSTLAMVESITQLKSEVDNTLKRLGHADLCLTELETDILRDLVIFLKPFEQFTHLISVSGPSLSLIPLMKTKIKKLCEPKSSDDPVIKKLKRNVLANVENRIQENHYVKTLQVLDPETKGLVPAEEARAIIKAAIQTAHDKGVFKLAHESNAGLKHIVNYCDVETDVIDVDTHVPIKRKKPSLRQELLMEMKNEQEQSGQLNNDSKHETEIISYISISAVEDRHKDNVLQFWKDYESSYPTLSKVAKMYLGMASGSVPAEAMFSITGLILNGRRSSLCPEKMNRVSFIHDNFDVIHNK